MTDEELVERAAWNIDLLLRDLAGDQSARHILRVADNRVALERLREMLFERARRNAPLDPSEDESRILHYIVYPGIEAAKDALKYLRLWLKGAKRVMICDPYLLQRPPSPAFANEEEYVRELLAIFPASAKQVDIFCNGYKLPIRTAFWRELKEGRQAKIISTRLIHDRFVVKDGVVKCLGTSIGGFGNKLSIVTDLDDDDAKVVIRELSALRRGR